jgi:cysteine dioxygenase
VTDQDLPPTPGDRVIPSVPVEQFVAGLGAIPPERFGVGSVYEYIRRHPVDESSLTPYLFFDGAHYTRNLIFKNDLFELLALCWEVGQASRIHNHHNQNCWMAIPLGRLRVQNFRVLEQNAASGFCRLEPTTALDIHRDLPVEVDPAEPVHQVLNLAEWGKRAVSLHVYSRPFDQCLVYSLEKQTYSSVTLHYTSVYGERCVSPPGESADD